MNWKKICSALTAALTIMAALPYQLGDIATIIPSWAKQYVVVGGLIATTILRVLDGSRPARKKVTRRKRHVKVRRRR